MRAVAVGSVIISHTDARVLPSGYLGVDVFFVLSGFVITASLMRYEHETLSVFILSFYQRRVKRLIPALAFFVLITASIIALIDELPRSALMTGAASMFGVSNIYLVREAVDYFSPSTELNAFVHTWSLGVEEQFYLFFPVLFWFTLGQGRIHPFKNTFVLWIGALSALSLFGFWFFYQSHQPYAYFLMPTRFWELGAGALTYACTVSRAPIAVWLHQRSPSLLLCCLILIFLSPTSFAVANTLAIVILTGLLIVTVRTNTWAFALLTMRVTVFLGLISYSLYLWHWGVLTIAQLTIGVSLGTIPFLFMVMLGMATFSYYYVEKPLRYGQWSPSAALTITKGVGVSVACTIAVLSLASLHQRINLATLLGYEVEHVTQTWWEDRRTGVFLETCSPPYDYKPELLDICFPQKQSGPRAFLLGDSHARNHLMTVQSAFSQYSVSYLTMGHNCAYTPMSLSKAPDWTACADYVQDSTERILSLVQPGDIVVIGQRLLHNPERESTVYMSFLAARSQRFIARGARVVVLDSVLPSRTDPRFCLDLPWRPARHGCEVSRAETEAAFVTFDRLAGILADEHDRIFYARLRTGLCNDMSCGQLSPEGHPVWHDRGHITERVAAELAPHLLAELKQQGFDD